MDKKQYRILIVEDNPGDFALVEDFLFEQIEAPVITWCKNFKQAHDNLMDAECDFEVILLDLSLPDKSREDLIPDILSICANIPLIALTGYSDFAFSAKSLALGVSDYTLKDELTATTLHKSIVYSIGRKKSIADLQESEKKYADLFNLSPLPMWVLNLSTLKFLDVNEATVRHYGYTREEFLTMTVKDLRAPEDIPELMQILEEGAKQPDKADKRLVVHKLKSGELRNVEIQIAPYKYKNVNASIVIATDITDRLNYVHAIEDQNQKLKEISWIQSHVIRAPLSRIMGLIPLIVGVAADDDDLKRMLEYLTQSANDLDEVIKTITDKTTDAQIG